MPENWKDSGWRGRGGSYRRGRSQGYHNSQSSSSRDIGWKGRDSSVHYDELDKLPKGEVIDTINPEAVFINKNSGSGKLRNASKSGMYLASYNWVGGPEDSTMVVPGMPAEWHPPAEPEKLSEDSGGYFRDINAAYYKNYPIEPMLRAIYAQQPHFDGADVDLVTCSHTLTSLLLFTSGNEKSFRFRVEIIDGTAFLIRREYSHDSLIDNVRGFGHTFPASYTSWHKSVQGSKAHMRVYRYNLGDFRCIVRTGCDGYLPESFLPAESNIVTLSQDEHRQDSDDQVITDAKSSNGDLAGLLKLRYGGELVAQDRTFELKTRSIRTQIDQQEFNMKSWCQCTENFILARHQSGNFSQIEIENIADKLSEWEDSNVKLLQRTLSVLKWIIENAKRSKSRKVEVVRLGKGALQIRKLHASDEAWSALPSDMSAAWSKKTSGPRATTRSCEGIDNHSNTEDGGNDFIESDNQDSDDNDDDDNESYLLL